MGSFDSLHGHIAQTNQRSLAVLPSLGKESQHPARRLPTGWPGADGSSWAEFAIVSTDTSFSPPAAIKVPRWWPRFFPAGGHEDSPGVELGRLCQGLHPPAGGGLGEPVGVT